MYRAPYQTAGPYRRALPDGTVVLVFSYASFVFEWVEGAAAIRVGMGTLERYSLNWSQPVRCPWSAQVLAQLGREWAESHMARFRK
ncbi:hypothetical protein EV191_1279 [Tamaricihabitans halophyticus]|uniref:Uncharacterized protein n=1 Tax=Tamaricihabitans halophyticus TaxID=1262583 RepID=A0A4R2Q3A8_9PSEU|nr:hypothetical protein EV191_1279 [Tamaricihabitans halophyticus]